MPPYLIPLGMSLVRINVPIVSIPVKACIKAILPQINPATIPIHGPNAQAMMATGIPIKVMDRPIIFIVPSGVKPKMSMMAKIRPHRVIR